MKAQKVWLRVIAGVVLMALIPCVCGALDQPQYGPWMPLKDGHLDGVQISFKRFANGTQYYKLKNTYPVTVKVECKFSFTGMDGKRNTEQACGANKLQPGQEMKDPGWFDFGVASVDESSLTAKVRSVNAGDDLNDATVSPNAGREGTGQAAPNNGTCAVGQKRDGYSDGEHRAPGYAWEANTMADANRCPAENIAGTTISRFAVLERDNLLDVVTAGGVVTQCKTEYQTKFIKCVTASEEMDYPKKGFSFHTPSSAIGDKD